jgi:hypothetical protein
MLSEEEVKLWQEDSLDYFLTMKEESNKFKGNYLRDKTERLIGALELRYTEFFQAFSA